MDTISISHTAASGTMASGNTRPHAATFKANGWRWGRSITAWYVPHSRDSMPNMSKINRTIDALRAGGADVELDIDATSRPIEEREADRAERIAARQERLTTKAERLAGVSAAHVAKVDAIASHIPFGQPILVGHHSEKAARRDQQRIWDGMGKAVAADNESQEATYQVEASRKNEARRLTAPATMRRIEKLEAEKRDIQRRIERKGRDYHTVSGLMASEILANTEADISYWRGHLASLEEQGVKVWGPDDFQKGDRVVYWAGMETVIRVNKKSLTITTPYSWTRTIRYDEVQRKIAAQ